jgi:UDP-N-acetylmuramoyl-tripeptide--D-alanyl-D-alanine ligase
MAEHGSLFRADRVLFTSGEVAALVGGACMGDLTAPVLYVVVDSRKAGPGSLFVALKGEKTDGHLFISQVLNDQAACVIADARTAAMSRQVFDSSGKVANSCLVLVDSPLAALQALAREHRRRMKDLVRIGVTGSSGKTTTKECIAAILSAAYGGAGDQVAGSASSHGPVIMSPGNLNSDIGLALSLFGINRSHKIGVFEMGMNRRGEMDELVRMFEPDYAVVTNVGTAHIGIIGSRQGIAEEKKKIFSGFTGSQVGFIWENDDFADYLEAGIKGRVVRFGISSTKGLEKVVNRGLSGWEIDWMGRKIDFALVGTHNLLDALAALSLASELGIDTKAVCAGLASVHPLFGRSEIFTGQVTLFQDCYNSNPDSVEAAMDFCDGLFWKGRKIFVLGSMLELGAESETEHVRMGLHAAESTADAVFFFGEETAIAYDELKRRRPEMPSSHTNDMGELSNAVGHYIQQGDLLMFKASRGMELERLTETLRQSGMITGNTDSRKGHECSVETEGAKNVP